MLALILVLVSGGASAPTPQASGVAMVVREACFDTAFDRSAFEALGRARRWRALRSTGGSGHLNWEVAFRTSDAQVMLHQVRGFGDGDPAMGSVCTVTVERPASGLLPEIEALAAEAGMVGDAAPMILGSGSMRTWSSAGLTLTYAAGISGGRPVAISLSRQIVVDQTDTAVQP